MFEIESYGVKDPLNYGFQPVTGIYRPYSRAIPKLIESLSPYQTQCNAVTDCVHTVSLASHWFSTVLLQQLDSDVYRNIRGYSE